MLCNLTMESLAYLKFGFQGQSELLESHNLNETQSTGTQGTDKRSQEARLKECLVS